MADEKIYDVIIIGGGPAGLSAGIYTSRAKLSSLLMISLIIYDNRKMAGICLCPNLGIYALTRVFMP